MNNKVIKTKSVKNSDTHWIPHRVSNRVANRKGFTIAEMLIVTIILGVLFSIGTRTYFRERDRFEFNNAFTKILSIIKTARNFASTSRPVYIEAEDRNIIPADGYGVYIKIDPTGNNSFFTLFANTDGLNIKDDKPNRFDQNDKEIESYRLPKKVDFRSFDFDDLNDVPDLGLVEQWTATPSPGIPSQTEAVIIFRPPLAQTFIGNNLLNPNDIEIDELRMNFINPAAPDVSPKKCQFISIKRAKTFPELRYGAFDQIGKCIRPSS